MSAVVLLLASCIKNKPDNPYGTVEFFAEEADESLSPATKGFLTDARLKTNTNRIHVMDVLTGFTGSATWYSNDLYINDEIVYDGNTIWDFKSHRIYPWTVDGVHRFFGWLSYNATLLNEEALHEEPGVTADSFFGATLANNFTKTNDVWSLSIPAREMNVDTIATPQYDFMYDNMDNNYIMPRTDLSLVRLQMSHLFSAISLQFYNESRDPVIVRSVEINGLRNKKSVVIPMDSSPVFTSHDSTARFVPVRDNLNLRLEQNGSYDIIAGRVTGVNGEFRLIWPQSAADLTPSDPEDYDTYPIIVHYEYPDEEIEEGDDPVLHTARLRFPEGAQLLPGIRYAYTLLFTQKHIKLDFTVNPWHYSEYVWSFGDNSISGTETLTFWGDDLGNQSVNNSTKECTIVGGNSVKGKFKISTPPGATWSIEPLGDVEYFTVTPSSGNVAEADVTNKWYQFEVIPNLDSSLDRSTDKKLRFKIRVTFMDGSVHDGDSDLNRDNWTVILPKI